MDLDDFDAALADLRLDEEPQSPSQNSVSGVKDAVAYIDREWYTFVNRRGRWMDLIGDYAGSEPFVVDGEALVQLVLDDPLLSIGREDDVSFQSVHAVYAFERILRDISRRSESFEIVFWHDRRYLTLSYGESNYVSSSRSVARQILFNHVKSLDIPVHTFLDLSDPAWVSYQRLTKPMFIMTTDGGVLDDDSPDSTAEYVLLQRVFLYSLLSQGISVTLLRGAQYRDSKIMSFVYEQRPETNPEARFKKTFWSTVRQCSQSLASREKQARMGSPSKPLSSDTSACEDATEQFLHFASPCFEPHAEHQIALLHIFAAHMLVTPQLDLKERARPPVPFSREFTRVITAFLHRVFLFIEDIASPSVLDGRVFASLINNVVRTKHLSLTPLLSPQLTARLAQLWQSHGLPNPNLTSLRLRFPPSQVVHHTEGEQLPLSVLPFSHPLFDDELSAVRIDADKGSDEEDEEVHLEFNTPFLDTQHWHNHKRAILPSHLGGNDSIGPMDEKQKRRQLRSEQRFMSKLQWQAETLTGALGSPLQQIVIPSAATTRKSRMGASPASKVEEIVKPSKPAKPAGGKKGKKETLSSADKIRLANQAKKLAKEDDSNAVWWRDQLRALNDKSNTTARIAALDVLMRNKRTKDGWLAVEVHLFRLHLELTRWLEDPARESAAARDRFSVSVLCMAKELYESRALFPAAAAKLATVLIALGFSAHIEAFEAGATVVEDERALSFEFVKLVKSKSGNPVHKWMAIVEDPVVWQLRLFGEFMDRSMDSQSDPRVSFKPDAWQREVLDCLDRNESVLVAAPTSAGKTFISYYAMEKLLRTSDDDILVYVAPTKALVSQIAAEVYARFRKELGSKACWAIHTRDYRVHNPQNCQILVTVPEMLAIMLLSPPLARTWTPRIKRIILDEIHTIGQQEGGAVWEQIILLAPCPLIGLSATIGEPEKFNAWLASVQQTHGFKHTFIRHPHRYSHLRKFTYVIQPGHKTGVFQGLPEHKKTDRLRFLHPISMLSFGVRRLPPDFSLEAADCLSLYRAFKANQERLDFDIKSLDPTQFFKDSQGSLLKQRDILHYEAALTERISTMIDSTDPQEQGSVLNTIIGAVTDPVLEKIDHRYVPDSKQHFANLISLVSDLHADGDLPALLFNFDRKACEKMAQALLDVLELSEARWRETNPEWKRKIKQWELWVSKAKERERQVERLKKAKKDENDGPSATAESEATWEASFDPEDPSPQFSFAGMSPVFTREDLEEEIRSLARWSSAPEWALKGLRRGIGVHHSGMNKHYRTLVESLYRAGFLRVVIATGTLALGINAPTKTSVFCGDSPFLTALMYRQCAGRAGRRGFDLLGKVVFYSLPMDRCQRLVLSKLPSLGGNFPLTSTMVLRLFNLLQGSDDAPVARDAIRSLLRLPHISFVSDVGREQILHHIRFSIDYLRRSGLLDPEGNPINLFGVAAHLYYTEPSNLALVALMRHGVIHRICNQTSLISAKRELMLLFSHLFGRRYLPKAYASQQFLKAITQKSPSMVVLPPLPEDARTVLLEHEDHIKRVYTGYALAYVSHHGEELAEDVTLPLSHRTLCPKPAHADSTPFRKHLRDTAVSSSVRSSFVASSGHGDHFATVKELTDTSRDMLHLNEYAIPSMRQFTSIPGKDRGVEEEFALNAYLLDFYTHGQTAALRAANGIRDGEVWYVLQDFSLTLKAIRTGLAQPLQKAAAAEAVNRADSAAGDEASELDSGYGTMATGGDPAEADPDAEGSEQGDFKRPTGVSDRDWRVYEVVNGITAEFDEKFRAMWA